MDAYLLENGVDRYLLEDGTGVYLLEQQAGGDVFIVGLDNITRGVVAVTAAAMGGVLQT